MVPTTVKLRLQKGRGERKGGISFENEEVDKTALCWQFKLSEPGKYDQSSLRKADARMERPGMSYCNLRGCRPPE
jgi:hypothetical protein